MSAVVLDTDVVSFLFKGDTRGRWYLNRLGGRDRFISFMTLAELQRWAVQHNWGSRKYDEFERYLGQYTIYFVDPSLCRFWAEVMVQARRKGRPIEGADAWIATTALTLGVPLVTHNPRDYAGVTGLTIVTETAI